MAVTKVTTKVLADDAVTINKIADAALVTESEGISSSDNDTTIPTSAAVKDYVDTQDATKEDTITGAATTITSSDLTASKVLISNGSGKVAISSFMDTDETNNILDITGKVYFANVFSLESDLPSATTYHGMFAHVHGTGYAYYAHAGNWVKLAKYSELSDTTYTISAVDSGDNAIIRLTDSSSGTDDIILEAGNNITLTPSGDTITIASTASGSVSDAFKTISVSGQSDVVADSATDTLTLAAGSNITLTTNASTDTITIASTASGGGGGGTLDIEQDTFDGDGSTVAFALTSSADSENNLQVFIDGVYQSKDNFSVSGSTLTFSTAPNTGVANIEVIHLKSVVGKVRIDSFTGDGSDTTFDLTHSISNENNTQVFVDGVYQSKDNYSTSGTTITFSTAPPNGSAIEVVHIVPDASGGGIDWQTTAKTAAFTATAGEGYFVNTTSAAITVTLPSSPSAGDEVSIVDYAGTANTNNITITSSNNINGASNDVLIDYERGGVSIVYVDATQGWIAYNAANETNRALTPDLPLTVDYLVVAGGGSGSGSHGGGGGAGGLRTSYGSTSGGGASAESSLSLATATSYTITIGAGGSAPSPGGNNGNSGSNSVFANITSIGGGWGQYSSSGNAGSGGSGGGSSYGNSGGSGTANQGYAGGNGISNYENGAGGGGASQTGYDNTSSAGGNGGNGLAVEITGSAVTYAGGGGGGINAAGSGSSPGSGGTGGGGSATTGTGQSGTVNTGGGGSGGYYIGSHSTGGSGGSGVVILRYPDAYTISETTSGGNVLSFTTDDTTVSGTKITTFTAGENGTIQFS